MLVVVDDKIITLIAFFFYFSGFEFLDGSRFPVTIPDDNNPTGSPTKVDFPKGFACSFCDRICGNRSHLRQHERIHTGEKPYKCDACDMAFNQKGTLNTHYRIHTGERPYKCQFCGKAFVSRAPLNYHVKKNHPDLL